MQNTFWGCQLFFLNKLKKRHRDIWADLLSRPPVRMIHSPSNSTCLFSGWCVGNSEFANTIVTRSNAKKMEHWNSRYVFKQTSLNIFHNGNHYHMSPRKTRHFTTYGSYTKFLNISKRFQVGNTHNTSCLHSWLNFQHLPLTTQNHVYLTTAPCINHSAVPPELYILSQPLLSKIENLVTQHGWIR